MLHVFLGKGVNGDMTQHFQGARETHVAIQ